MNKKGAVFTALGFECFGLVFACVFIGRYLDAHFSSGSLWAAVGAIVGFTGWFIHLLIVIRQLANKDGSSHTDPQ